MSEEAQEASQEDIAPVASEEVSEITDEMLDRAAEGAEEETAVEADDSEVDEAEEEEGEAEIEAEAAEDAPEEPVDNAERSRLGRKVKELEDELIATRQNNGKVTDALEKLNAFLGKKEEPEEEEYFEMPETVQDLDALLDKRLAARERTQETLTSGNAKEYQDGYVDTVLDLLEDETPEEKQSILEMIDAEFNIKHSAVDSLQAGVKDAAKNVMAARKKILQTGVKTIPLKGKAPIAPLGGGGGDKMAEKSKKVVALDAEAKQLQKDLGLTDEFMNSALG